MLIREHTLALGLILPAAVASAQGIPLITPAQQLAAPSLGHIEHTLQPASAAIAPTTQTLSVSLEQTALPLPGIDLPATQGSFLLFAPDRRDLLEGKLLNVRPSYALAPETIVSRGLALPISEELLRPRALDTQRDAGPQFGVGFFIPSPGSAVALLAGAGMLTPRRRSR